VTTDADRCTEAYVAALRRLVRAAPGAYEVPGTGGVFGLVSGVPLPTVNGVVTEVREPSPGDVALVAAAMADVPLPWSIQVRGEPDAEIAEVGARYGLTRRHTLPLMLRRPDPARPLPPVRAPVADQVRVVKLADRAEFVAALAAGFEAPIEIMELFAAPEFFAIEESVPYGAEEDGQLVAVGLGIFLGEFAGIFNIATLPAYRGRGYGRAITSRIVGDGIERGAPLAYLQSSGAGYPLYESMGFQTLERWTYLVPERHQ